MHNTQTNACGLTDVSWQFLCIQAKPEYML